MNRLFSSLGSLAERVLLPLSLGGLVIGIGLWLAGRDDLAAVIWTIPSVVVAIWLAGSILADLIATRNGVLMEKAEASAGLKRA